MLRAAGDRLGGDGMSGIVRLAVGIEAELARRLPRQRKTQRGKLALLMATMLDERSANLMDLAAALPRPAERLDMRYQWIAGSWPTRGWTRRGDGALRREVRPAGRGGRTVVLMMDQSGRDPAPDAGGERGWASGPCRWRGGSRRPGQHRLRRAAGGAGSGRRWLPAGAGRSSWATASTAAPT